MGEEGEESEGEEPGGGGGTGQPRGGGVKDEGEREVVVDEGNGDGEEGEGVEVVDPPPSPPLRGGSSKPWAPKTATARKAGAIGWSAKVLEPGCAGDEPVFSSPAHSHMPTWPSRRPNQPQRPTREPPRWPPPQRLSCEMPWG